MKSVEPPTILHKPQMNASLRPKENLRLAKEELGYQPTKVLQQNTLTIDRD